MDQYFQEMRRAVLSGKQYTLPNGAMSDQDVEIHALRILTQLDNAYISDVERILARVREIMVSTQIVLVASIADDVCGRPDQE